MAENVFKDGDADKRQDDSLKAGEPDLFRTRYRKLEPSEVELHDRIKAVASHLHQLIQQVGGEHTIHPNKAVGANKQLAVRHLEDCVYRAVKALTA